MPGLNDDVLWHGGTQDLVPTGHKLLVLANNSFYARGEILLQFLDGRHTMSAHIFLNTGIRVPLLPVHLIATDVEVTLRKKSSHLTDKFIEKNVGFFAGGVHRGIEDSPFALGLVRAGRTREFRVADEPTRAVPRHIKLRNHANAVVACIRNKFADLILSVVKTVGPHLLQLWKLLALDSESLIVRQMQVQNV